MLKYSYIIPAPKRTKYFTLTTWINLVKLGLNEKLLAMIELWSEICLRMETLFLDLNVNGSYHYQEVLGPPPTGYEAPKNLVQRNTLAISPSRSISLLVCSEFIDLQSLIKRTAQTRAENALDRLTASYTRVTVLALRDTQTSFKLYYREIKKKKKM